MFVRQATAPGSLVIRTICGQWQHCVDWYRFCLLGDSMDFGSQLHQRRFTQLVSAILEVPSGKPVTVKPPVVGTDVPGCGVCVYLGFNVADFEKTLLVYLFDEESLLHVCV